jgi:hypothetical protein
VRSIHEAEEAEVMVRQVKEEAQRDRQGRVEAEERECLVKAEAQRGCQGRVEAEEREHMLLALLAQHNSTHTLQVNGG